MGKINFLTINKNNMDNFEELISLMDKFKVDARLHLVEGNEAAGRRARVASMTIRASLKEFRAISSAASQKKREVKAKNK